MSTINRLCSHCKNPGHTINKCTHSSAQKLIQDTQDMANYSVGHSFPQCIEVWLNKLTIPQLRILRYRYNIVSAHYHHQTKTNYIIQLMQFYYMNHLIEPASIAIANENLTGDRLFAVKSHIIRWMQEGTIVYTPQQLAIVRLREADAIMEIINTLLINANAAMQFAQNNIQQAHLLQDRERDIRAGVAAQQQQQHDEVFAQREGVIMSLPRHRKYNINSVMNTEKTENQETDCDCPICYDNINSKDIVSTNCNHKLCVPCLSRYFDSLNQYANKQPVCSLCRTSVNQLTFNNEEHLANINDKYCIDSNLEVDQEALEVAEAAAALVEIEYVEWIIDRNPDPIDI